MKKINKLNELNKLKEDYKDDKNKSNDAQPVMSTEGLDDDEDNYISKDIKSLKSQNMTNETDDLEEIEDEIAVLLNKSISDWIDFYLLTQNAKENKLFKPKFKSYTAWINNLAETNNIHVSILWQRLKAGGVFKRYLDLKEKYKQLEEIERENKKFVIDNEIDTFEDLKNLKVSPESIELCNKIAGGNDIVFNNLMNKTLKGELTREDLRYARWEVERIKENRLKDKESKELKEDEKEELDNEISDFILNKYVDKSNKVDENELKNNVKDDKTLKLTNFITSYYNLDLFLNELDNLLIKRDEIELTKDDNFKETKTETYKEFPIGNSITRHSRRADVGIIENITLHGHELTDRRVNLHGIEIKTSENDLKQDKKMGEYTENFDFCWLYVTEELKDLALKLKPNNWGLLVFKTLENGNDCIEIVELAERKDYPLNIEKSLRNLINKIL